MKSGLPNYGEVKLTGYEDLPFVEKDGFRAQDCQRRLGCNTPRDLVDPGVQLLSSGERSTDLTRENTVTF